MNYGTVDFDKATVGFIEATDWLKAAKGLKYKEIGNRLGLSSSQMDMIRAKRRQINGEELDIFLQAFPDTERFFSKLEQIEIDPWQKLVLTQEELIEAKRKENERLERENEWLQKQVEQLENQINAMRNKN